MENEHRIEVVNMPDTRDNSLEIISCSTYCPADCGCESAWNTCIIGN